MKRTKLVKSTANRKHGCTFFEAWMLKDATDLVGKLGARNSDLAIYFGVSLKTIEHWITANVDFRRAVRKGRVEAGLKVSKALFRSAIGYKHEDSQFFQYKGGIIEKKYIKHYPPNVLAAKTYLQIMFRETWTEAVKVDVNHTGTVGYKKIEEIPIEELSKEQQDLLFTINMKQLTDIQQN